MLHYMAELGIESANIGLPGAGPHVAQDTLRLAQEIADRKLPIFPNCAARTLASDIRPIVEIAQRAGIAIEVACFLGSSPVRQYAEGWTIDRLLQLTEEAVALAVGEGMPVMYVTEDTTRAQPEDLRRLYTAAVEAGARRRVRRRHGRATPRPTARAGSSRSSASVVGRDRRGREGRLARAPRPRPRRVERPRRRRRGRRPPPRHRGRHRRAGRQRADRPAAGQHAAPGLDRSRPLGAPRLLPPGRRDHRRAAARQLSGARPRRLPHRHRRARGGDHQGPRQGRRLAGGPGLLRRAGEHGRPAPADRDRPDERQVQRRVLAARARRRPRSRRWSTPSSSAPRPRTTC